MSGDSKMDRAVMRLATDQRATVWHMSLYIAILHSWCENQFQPSFCVSRRELMKFAHIGSIATYHKCLKQLIEYGYISYLPSYNPSSKTVVSLQGN